jgi:pimeloyl-ACP methyl ester carboxylesterase
MHAHLPGMQAIVRFFSRRRFWGMGLGAGVVGAIALTARYAFRTRRPVKIPETISPAIFATRVFYTAKGQLVYHESGKGDPLVFIHGIYPGASSFEWSRVYPHFADRFQVLAPDLMGFGESARPRRPCGVYEQVEILAEFFRAKGGDLSSVIVASGMGAALAVLLAERHPELVKRLLLVMPIDATTKRKGRRFPPRRWIAAVPFAGRPYYYRFLAARARIRLWLATACFAEPEKVDDETIDVFSTCARQFGADRAAMYWLRGKLDVDLERHLAEVPHPVTLIWSDEAPGCNPEIGYRLQKIPKQCNFVVLEKSGVFPALETSKEFVELLNRELDSKLRVYPGKGEEEKAG